MHIKFLLVLSFCSATMTSFSQTLFTYGDRTVDAKEFLRAFNKNNQAAENGKAVAMKDYLELYINSKLKVREAGERGFDTLPTIKGEMENLRTQIIDNYMADPKTEERLITEAFQRSLKDIHVAHIFVSLKNSNGNLDSAAADQKLKAIQQRLRQGEDFLTVAQQTSDDPAAKANKGDIGFITLFTLPYDFENIIYTTAPGKYSEPYSSQTGYHIFKNLGERKAIGRMKAQQLLLAYPPGSDEQTKKQVAQKADSIYKRIMAGDDFGKLATQFSYDYITAASSGNMPEFGTGDYDPVFENAIMSLPKDGAVSKPFQTSHGYHIVKRNSIIPVVSDLANKVNLHELKLKVMKDGRWQKSRGVFYQFVIEKVGYESFLKDYNPLWLWTDSLLNKKPIGKEINLDKNTLLFRIGDSTLKVDNFVTYASTSGHKTDGTGLKHHPEILDQFNEEVVFQYYRDHLEKYNDEFRYQLNEFREGNLFFEIMQQEIWNRSQVDSAALLDVYQKNKAKYTWQPSADAVIFFCSDETICRTLQAQVKKSPSRWKALTDSQGEKVLGDSARYEFNQIPTAGKTTLTAGMITSLITNKEDNTASFAYIRKVYSQTEQRNFEEAKGLVINDYQSMLDEKWIAELKKKYPVVIDQKVLADISK